MWKSDCSFATTWWDVCVCVFVCAKQFSFLLHVVGWWSHCHVQNSANHMFMEIVCKMVPNPKTPPRSLLTELLKVWSCAHFAGWKAVVRTEKCPHKVRKVWEENYIAIMLEVIRKLCEAGFLAIFKRSIFFCFILNMRKHFLNKSIVTTIILKCLFILLLKLQDLNF